MKKVVRTFLKNNEWKFLFVKHKWKDYWSLPGWHIEWNEDIYKAIKREIKEELNLKIKILWNKIWLDIENIKELATPVAVYKIEFENNKWKKLKKLEYIFLSEIKSWDIKIQEEEIDEYKFFSADEVLELENTFLQVKEILKKIAI